MRPQARVIVISIAALSWIFSGVVAHASCKPFGRPNLAHAPMDVAIVTELEDAELEKDVTYLNSHQSHYHLTLLEDNSVWSRIQANLGYDVIVAVDREMMEGDKPKYNQYLASYRDEDISAQTMIIDWRFNDKNEVDSAFIQISAANAQARSRLLELGLLALAGRGWAFEPDVQDYVARIDKIVERDDAMLSASAIAEIEEARKGVVASCFAEGE
jgi:hypothetical protein